MRCFIAIDIDDKTKKALSDLQKQLSENADIKKSDVKWVRPEAMHLTLKFLGEIKDEEVVSVCDIVKNVAGQHKSFELDIESVGCFGGKNARVLWVGTGQGSDELCQLQKDIEQKLALAGWPEESREFTGHMTLGRVRDPRAGAKLAQMSKDYKNFKLGVVYADSVSVYQSQLRPTGPVYILLGNYKLS